MIAKQNIYLTEDRETVVDESDSRQAFQLVGGGCELATAEAEKYGLVGDPRWDADASEAEKPKKGKKADASEAEKPEEPGG